MSLSPSPIAAAALGEARGHAQGGRLAEALEAARRAAQADAGLGEAYAIWGVAAAELGRFNDAVEPLMAAAERIPAGSIGWANITSQLARALSNTGFWAEAVRRAEAVTAIDAPDPEVRERIGAAFARMNLPERGLPHLEWARGLRPDRPQLLAELGLAYMADGRLDAAEQAFEAAIDLSPRMVQPHAALAQLRRWTPGTAHVARLTAVRDDPRLESLERGSLGFALFKELDDLGAVEDAWRVLAEANEACRTEATVDWSAAGDAELMQSLMELFPVERLKAAPPPKDRAAPTPIFIVGLPRSGTTLLERMLAGHSEVQALGELPTFPIVFRTASSHTDRRSLTPEVIRAAAGGDWAAVGELYLQEIAPLGLEAPYVIDKLPANSLLVGAIRLALPRARIIHMRRAPMDALFGAYKVRFAGWYGWAYRQADMAAHFVNHQRLMDHWRAGLGPSLIELDYEALVQDPEPEIRRILAALGLAFEPACLEPHKTAGPVRTASMVQVREPISAARVGGWRRYESQLEPLRAALQAQGIAAD
ncbi:MAG: hypothetical protein JWP50_2750 [Phenylobacterium sp.]|nr:hypothetical protein [Phenylobacterium sp.]